MARENETPNETPIETVLHDDQNWAARSHRELYAAVHNNNDPGQAGEIGSEWAQFGSEMTEAAQVVADRVAKSETGWSGEAADSARAALKLLSDWVTETAQTTVEVGNRVAEQGRIMATARANMPEPKEFSYDAATQTLAAPGLAPFVASAQDVQAANEQSRAAHEQAVVVMDAMEQSSRDIDRTTPVFKPPFNPVTGETEEPVVPMARMSGGPSLAATGVEALQSNQNGTASQYAAPSGGASAPAAAAAPNAPAYAPPSGGNGAPNAPAPQWQQPSYSDTTAASATTWAPQTPQMPQGQTDYRPTMPSSGNVPWDPYSSGYPNSSGKGGTTPAKGTVPPMPGATPPGTTPGKPGTPGMPGGSGGGTGGGGGGAAAAAAKAGFGGGAFGAAGGPGAAGGQMQPGGTTGAVQTGGQQAQLRGGAMPAGPGGAAAAGMGGAPMGGPMGAGRGEEDKEHRSASYIMSGDLFEVPGENLPPAVIGGAKKKKAPEQ